MYSFVGAQWQCQYKMAENQNAIAMLNLRKLDCLSFILSLRQLKNMRISVSFHIVIEQKLANKSKVKV